MNQGQTCILALGRKEMLVKAFFFGCTRFNLVVLRFRKNIKSLKP
jgi:hypothetical protein